MKNVFKKVFALSILAAAAISSQAATTAANFTATATVNASCVITASPVAFGSITPAATGDATATGTLTSTCSNGTGYTLTLNKGSGASIGARSMAGTATNTDKLLYNLYTNAGATSIFGDTVEGNTLAASGTGVAQTQTIYGKLALNQYIKSDTYTDNLTVTLTY